MWIYQCTDRNFYIYFEIYIGHWSFKLNFKIKMVCKQYGIPLCAHSLNAKCPYTKNWPADASLDPKHVANYVLIDYICVVFD
jgi:hypothetical protein